MISFFHFLSIFEANDLVGVLDRGKSMGDDEGSSADGGFFEGLLDDLFGFGVEGGGGFVEEEDFWVSDKGSKRKSKRKNP